MSSGHQETRTDGSCCTNRTSSHFKLTGCLKLIFSLLLLLVLGFFTVAVTFQLESIAKQRDEDRQAINLLREQERNLSDQRYLNERYDTYIQEMSKLLIEYNGSLVSSKVAATLARVKTLNVFRLLDSTRNTRVIQFLHETKQLTDLGDSHALDLSTAKLRDIDFRDISIDETYLADISLAGVFLLNAIFTNISMRYANFSHTQFSTSTFTYANLYWTSFEVSRFKGVDFLSTQLKDVNFIRASVINVSFISSEFQNVAFSFARLENVDFSFATFYNVDFSKTLFLNVNFSHTSFINVKFTQATLQNVNFSYAELTYPDFSFADLQNANFYSAILSNNCCHFRTSIVKYIFTFS